MKIDANILNALHFYYQQIKRRLCCFFNEKRNEIGIEWRATEHSAQIFLLSTFAIQLNNAVDDYFFRFELEKESEDVIKYVNEHSQHILDNYYQCVYDFLEDERNVQNSDAVGRVVYHQLFLCEDQYDYRDKRDYDPSPSFLDACTDEIYQLVMIYGYEYSEFIKSCASKNPPERRKSLKDRMEDRKVVKQFNEVRKQLAAYFSQHKTKAADEIVCDFEIDHLTYFLVAENTKINDLSILSEKYPTLKFASEDLLSAYTQAMHKKALGHFALIRNCYAQGAIFDVDRVLKYDLSERLKNEADSLIDNIRARFTASFDDRQKLFLCMAGAAVVVLLLAICNVLFARHGFPYGFYVFMRIVTCAALIVLLLEKLPVWVKFVLLLLAILYNPIVQIHIGDREVWAWFNAATIPALVAPWVLICKKEYKK